MKVLMGKQIFGELTNIKDIHNEDISSGPVIVEGKLVGVELLTFNSGARIQRGKIEQYDKEAISFQFWVDRDLGPIDIKSGQWVRVQGDPYKDEKWTRGEYEIKIVNLVEIESKEVKRIDKAEKKWFPLQVMTKASQMEGPTHIKKYASELKRMGYKGFALTDVTSLQSYPDAWSITKEEEDFDIYYGMTANLVETLVPIVWGPTNAPIFEQSYVVFDVETTGFSVVDETIIEIGAAKIVNREIVDTFQVFVKAPKPVPAHIIELTGITQDLIDKHGIDLENAMSSFHDFCKGSVLVAHNARFDKDFLRAAYKRVKQPYPNYTIMDTLELSRALNPSYKKHTLDFIAKQLGISLEGHHRADQDAEATAKILIQFFETLAENHPEIVDFDGINALLDPEEKYKDYFPNRIVILAKNQVGLKNLYKLVSLAHDKRLGRSVPKVFSLGALAKKGPLLTKEDIMKHREGLLIGSGGHTGPVFQLALDKLSEDVYEEMKFYDFIQIEPSDNAQHLAHRTSAENMASIDRAWKTVYTLAKRMGKLPVATANVHYLNPEEKIQYDILLYSAIAGIPHHMKEGKLEDPLGPCHFRTTDEMLQSYPWLSEEETYELVVTNTNKVADELTTFAPVPKDLYPPKIEGIDEKFKNLAYTQAENTYGSPLPLYVKARLDREIDSIVGNGYAVIYMISSDLVKKSNEDGYLVGSRGSIGSSLAATMTGITEVNPLEPHYLCKSCQWHMFLKHEDLGSGYDLPSRFATIFRKNEKEGYRYSESFRNYMKERFEEEFGSEVKTIIEEQSFNCCPKCKAESLVGEGQDIPFETFLGFKGEKVPDIDLSVTRS